MLNVLTFSIHYWIVFLETTRASSPAAARKWTFSIHYWIVFLETEWWQVETISGKSFQYPLLDRISWNFFGPRFADIQAQTFSIHYWIVFLETSRAGRNRAAEGRTFSIHYWIVFLETSRCGWRYPGASVFQYPLLDRISWNHICASVMRAIPGLSVSTIGSYFLKPHIPGSTTHASRTFSIHYWIVFLETLAQTSIATLTVAFQYPLLDRISWNFGSRLRGWCDCFFQYPLLDRISWNLAAEAHLRRFVLLSVSTIGSYFLKRFHRIVDVVTDSLSVSTIGSYFLKLLDAGVPICVAQLFQYPLLDRISWNLDCPKCSTPLPASFSIHYWIVFLETVVALVSTTARRALSVSTIGSYFLKREQAPCRVARTVPFSIHYWIVFLETALCHWLASTAKNFQYPLLDRISWNRGKLYVIWRILALSVSTIGSYFLKLTWLARPTPCLESFSIHYWIVFLETRQNDITTYSLAAFQYPLLDRISWNPQARTFGSVFVVLSVSTIGSYFLKLRWILHGRPGPSPFSIHYWIVFLETFSVFRAHPLFIDFQYPLLDRISWNCRRSKGLNMRYQLSVSTIGSYFLKLLPPPPTPTGRSTFSIHYWIVFLET